MDLLVYKAKEKIYLEYFLYYNSLDHCRKNGCHDMTFNHRWICKIK